ncbi:hypothetical protein Tco_0579122, partial [Tanacetum coccineum]
VEEEGSRKTIKIYVAGAGAVAGAGNVASAGGAGAEKD